MPYTEQYIKELRTERRLFLIINVIAAIVAGIGAYVIIQQSNRIDNEQAAIKRESIVRSQQIQRQRFQSILSSCKAQNQRHDKTIHVLSVVARDYAHTSKLTPKQKIQLRASIKDNILLINALVPRQNCIKLVHKSVRPTTTTPGG